jgi:putative oxidoreductase
VHYVAMAHLTGGLFIVLGMLTRLTIIIQIPILIGAFLINFGGEMVLGNLLQAILALLLAIFFTIYGSGRHSVDYNLKLNM